MELPQITSRVVKLALYLEVIVKQFLFMHAYVKIPEKYDRDKSTTVRVGLRLIYAVFQNAALSTQAYS